MASDARPTAAAPDDDPYLWLEDIGGQAALAWVEAQNRCTLARFGGDRFFADRDAIAAILDRPDKLPLVVRRGAHLYNFWLDADHPRGLWRRTTFDSFRLEAPQWEVVLDVDALATREGEDWTWAGASTRPGTHDRAILRLSRGGSDAVVLREFDVGRKDFDAGGFEMAAKLQAMGYDQVYFYEPEAGGHGYGKDNRERATFSALGYIFLREKIGWSEE